MKNAISNLLLRFQKHKTICTVVITALVTAVATCIVIFSWQVRNSPNPSSIDEALSFEHVPQYYTASEKQKGGEYSIVSDECGILCAGNAFSTAQEAYKHPIKVEAPGATISLSCKDNEGSDITCAYSIPANESKLLRLWPHTWSKPYDCYLYVIVEGILQEEDFTQDADTMPECVEHYSSAPLSKAYGMYVVSNNQEGQICIGNAYSSAAAAYANPLIIIAKNINISLSDLFSTYSTTKHMFYLSNSSTLISTEGNGQKAYIYVVLKQPIAEETSISLQD